MKPASPTAIDMKLSDGHYFYFFPGIEIVIFGGEVAITFGGYRVIARKGFQGIYRAGSEIPAVFYPLWTRKQSIPDS